MEGFVFRKLALKHRTTKRVRFAYETTKEFDSGKLESYILSHKWATSVRINHFAKSIVIEYKESTPELIIDRLSKINFENINSPHTKEVLKDKRLLPLAAPLLALSMTPILPESLKLPVSIVASCQNILKGLSHIWEQGVSSEVLESLAIAISLYRKDYFAANTTNFLLKLSEYIEENIARKSDSMLQSLLVPDIKEVWVEVDGIEIKKAFEELKADDIVIVNAGDTIPIDGTVISGDALVNESSMSGETLPIQKSRGDIAISGTIIKEGRLRIWAENVGTQSAAYKITSLVKNSLASKSNAQVEASKLADKLVPITLGLAGFTYFATKSLDRVAAIFQADYSCALKLATPVAFKSAMYQAGKESSLIKGANIIEKIAVADVVVFDKTGTLSSGKLIVSDVFSLDEEWSKDSILSLAASIEEHYFHPIAEAVVNAAKTCENCRHFNHSEVEFIVAHGVGTFVNGKKVVIGSRHFLEEDEKIEFSLSNHIIEEELKKGRTLLYIGYDGKLLGLISMIDEIRQNAKHTIDRLRKLGVKELIMLTGDHEIKAKETANTLGLDAYHSGLLPQDKLNIIKKLKNEGKKVIFVGDGINDAPSLAESDVGIAMQRGADIARVTADVVLLIDDISAIADIKELSNKTINKVSQNYLATTWINSTILTLASLGVLSPVATSILHNGTTVGVLLNALKPTKIYK